MTGQFAQILNTYGKSVLLGGEGGTEVRAFVQMLRQQRTAVPETDTVFGAADLHRWLYIGPREHSLTAGDVLRFDNADYIVQNAAAVYVGGEQSHWWAILRPAREALV